MINAGNPEAFYRFVNNKLSGNSGVPVLKNAQGDDVVGDHEKACLLNDYFSSVCVDDNGVMPNFSCDKATPIETINFDEIKIMAAAKKIRSKSKTSCDPDGYPIILLTKLISVLSLPLSIMYNSFLSMGRIPSNWKLAYITPIFKKGAASDPSNYRPISCTSIFCKLMERVIAAELFSHLNKSNILNVNQHGFVTGRSTLSNLLETVTDWSLDIDNNITNTTISIDFQKAFDLVSHPKLLLKLNSYGVRGNLLALITDFLKDRKQMTKISDRLSSSQPVKSGVVQGSCIGPLLFIIFVNDIPSIFSKSIFTKIFADDLKIYTRIRCFLDEFLLQHNLNLLVNWSELWQLPISIGKCITMLIGILKHIHPPSPTRYFLNTTPLEYVSSVKDLGVIVDGNLQFKEHINRIVHNASCRASLILKCFQSHDINLLRRAFIVYVRPLLEYNSPVWSPHSVGEIKALESVQRRFTKKLPGISELNYENRLKKLSLETLEFRRLKVDLVTTYKIIFGQIKTASSTFFEFSDYTKTRGHRYKLKTPLSRTNIKKFSFSSRVIAPWNSLIKADFTNISKFKISLTTENLNQFLVVYKF